MFGTITAYADNGTAAAAQDPKAAIISFLPMILIFVLLYFIMIRPQKKQQKQQQAMREALKVGDKVVTIGGICGKVSKLKDEYAYLETSKPGEPDAKSYIKIVKSAIDKVEQ